MPSLRESILKFRDQYRLLSHQAGVMSEIPFALSNDVDASRCYAMQSGIYDMVADELDKILQSDSQEAE